MGKELQ